MPGSSTDSFMNELNIEQRGSISGQNRSSIPSRSGSTSPILNTSPLEGTSPISSPKLRRAFSSTFTLIREDDMENEDSPNEPNNNDSSILQSATFVEQNFFFRILLWWPMLLYMISKKFLGILLKPFSFATPTFWISECLWIFWKSIGIPITLYHWFVCIYTGVEHKQHKKIRTVLISSGSTIQTLHLARNFYSSGIRVVVFEIEGLFSLCRFSRAVDKFYSIPKPNPDAPHEYVASLCDIVEREKPTYYIPVCASSPAYYDAIAKPQLELLRCSSFIPNSKEVMILDDILEVMKRCRSHGISLPGHRIVSTKEELYRLYNIGWLTGYRNILVAAGNHGIIDRHKFILPPTNRDLKLTHEISDEKQWVVIRDIPGTHFLTCTTVKESQVVANVTCAVQHDTRSLIPQRSEEIEKWLDEFFSKIRFPKPINGHISFRFVKCDQTGMILPIGSRIGVSLPYICHTGVQTRILWKPCPHFSRQNSGPIVQEEGKYWIHEVLMNTLKHPSMNAVSKLIGTVIDKREAIFVAWDPLPYCAYYHFQLPFHSVKTFLQKRQTSRMMMQQTTPVH